MARLSSLEIFRCHPYVHVLSKTDLVNKSRCHFCLKPRSEEFLTCSGCQVFIYCDSKCQKSDWPIHQSECRCLINVLPDIPSDSTRILLRLLIRKKNGDDIKTFGENKLYQRRFVDLMSHFDELKKQGEYFDEDELSQLAGNEIELPEANILLDIYGKMLINAFQIPDEFLNKIGTGLYLSTSKLDHSCCPNCVYTYNGSEQIIRSIKEIEQPTPEKLFISYIDNAMTSWERRQLLEENYFFHCLCDWCVKEAKRIDRIMTSVKCPSPFCFGFSGFTKNNVDGLQLLPCSDCGKTDFPTEFGQKVLKFWIYAAQKVKELKQMDKNQDFKGLLQIAEKILEEFDKSFLHESNLQFIRVRELAKGACIELELWEQAAEYGDQALIQKIKCVPHPSSLLGLQFLELGKLNVNVGNINKAHWAFIKAENILRITHGEDNSFHREVTDLIGQCETVLQLPIDEAL